MENGGKLSIGMPTRSLFCVEAKQLTVKKRTRPINFPPIEAQERDVWHGWNG